MKRQLGQFCGVLAEPGLVELMLNADGTVWADRLGQGMAPVGRMPLASAESFIGTVASTLRGTVTRENPILECELPLEAPFDGSRFEALIPPVVPAPVFTIRRKASAVFTLQEYERQGIMSPRQRAAIEAAVAQRHNILVVGGTGTGKTTLTNAVIDHMVQAAPQHRIVIIEDTSELQCAAKNAVVMRATDTVDMQRLLKATMRLRPDRIIVGEVRGGEALSLLKAWNTGHPGGACTVHANHARAGLQRVEQLIAARPRIACTKAGKRMPPSRRQNPSGGMTQHRNTKTRHKVGLREVELVLAFRRYCDGSNRGIKSAG